ncbi:MAG: hypothetical protein COA79_14155 [Planctomycetota bacterium]|nr:MAG: hypothetical protein COA79_14155 [Planctomycetota bacterium]
MTRKANKLHYNAIMAIKREYFNLLAANSRSLSEMLKAVESQLKISLTIHDPLGIFHTSGLIYDWFRHSHELCDYKRKGEWDKRCRQTCLYDANKRAIENPTSFIKHCWKDLDEIVIPIYKEEQFQFILFAGIFKTSGSATYFEGSTLETYNQLNICDVEKGVELTRVLMSLGQGILSFLDNYYFSNLGDDRKIIVERFIYNHVGTKISLEKLAKHLHLSSSRTSHLVTSLFSKTFSQLVKEERIKRACSILKNSQKPINQIPILIGIENEYYFYRLFKKEMGVTPKHFRDESIK